ncbi:MAG: ATP-binding protein [Acidimicrobiia bacterium]
MTRATGLVGRAAALAAGLAAVDNALIGRGQLLLVSGEAGIGKTVLARELTDHAAGRGALVLWGQCWEGAGVPALWPWTQVLRSGLTARPGADLGEGGPLVADQASKPAGGDAEAARFRLFDAATGFLTAAAEGHGLVVVLDDLQWADDASLRLLQFASRHLTLDPVLIVGAYRDDEAHDRLRRVAADTESIPLAGLARPEVAELMTAISGTSPTEAGVASVWRRTGGNPFLVRELTRLTAAQDDAGGGATIAAVVLDRFRDILDRRLARLSQPCADLLAVSAVIGAEVPLTVLRGAIADTGDLPSLLDEAVGARVLVEATDAGSYRFCHDLFRETIVARLPSDARHRLHLTVGRALESLRDEGARVHPAELAAHFGGTGGATPSEAVRYGIAAADDVTARMAFEEACALYQQALAALDAAPDPDPSTRLDLLLRLGEVGNQSGDAASALGAYRDAGDLARHLNDVDGLARSAIGIHTLGWRASHEEPIARLEEAAGLLAETPSVLRARVLASLARELHHSLEMTNRDRALVLARRAVDLARTQEDAATLGYSLLALHDACWRPGTAAERLVLLDDMLSAATAASDDELVAQARLLRATALLELGDPEGSTELDLYCRLCEDLGHARARYGSLSRRAVLALLDGRLDEGSELAEGAFSLSQQIGEPDAAGVRETLLWAATRVGADLPTWSPRLASNPWPGTPVAEAVLLVAAGRLDAARSVLTRVDLDNLPHTYDLELLAFLADAMAAAGTAEQQDRVYQTLQPYAGTHVVVGGCASYFGAVDHYLALLAEANDRPADAVSHTEAALGMHERLGAVAWMRCSRALLDRLQASTGDPSPTGAYEFRREGDVWSLAFVGDQVHMPDSKGLRDIAVLLAHPGQAVSAKRLYAGDAARR